MVWSAARPPSLRRGARRSLALVAGAATVFGLVACSSDDGPTKAAEAPDKPVAVADEMAASQALLDSAEAVVVSSEDEGAQLSLL